MAPPDRLPQRSRDTPKDLTLVQALRSTGQLATQHRDEDPAWDELETRTDEVLARLGVDDATPAGSPGTGTVDRAQLPLSDHARTELLAALVALERDPDASRVAPVLERLSAITDTHR